MKKLRTLTLLACTLPASALAMSIEEKSGVLANCAAVYATSARFVEAGGLGDLAPEERANTVKMFDGMGAAALTAAFKYGEQAEVERKFKSYTKVYTDRVKKEKNTSSLGPQLEPCKILTNSSK